MVRSRADPTDRAGPTGRPIFILPDAARAHMRLTTTLAAHCLIPGDSNLLGGLCFSVRSSDELELPLELRKGGDVSVGVQS